MAFRKIWQVISLPEERMEKLRITSGTVLHLHGCERSSCNNSFLLCLLRKAVHRLRVPITLYSLLWLPALDRKADIMNEEVIKKDDVKTQENFPFPSPFMFMKWIYMTIYTPNRFESTTIKAFENYKVL